MANKKKNSEAAPTPEQQARAASSSRKKQRKTYVSKTVKIVLVVIGVLAMLLSVSAMACSGLMSQTESTSSGYKLTGGVAATINGTNLTEDTVTKQIMSMRTSYGYTKDKDWAQYLVDNDLTPKKYRKQLIDSYTQQILLQQAQKENGVTVSDEEVEKAWKDACKSAGGAKAFKKTLKTYGYTEDTYKDSLKESLAQQKLKDAVAPTSKPKDSEIVDYINENLSSYNDVRRSSNILIKVDSDASDEDKAAAKAKAQECLDKINSGELSF
ncbi:MAG: SurA N-terminal domain-containing protein, partial [Collinsella sp.]